MVSLNLSNNGLQADSIQTLAQARQMTQLQKIDLSSNLLTPQAMQHVVGANWTQLLALNLAHAGLGTDAIQVLAQASLPKLEAATTASALLQQIFLYKEAGPT